jgi:cell division septal protein FtsQ
MIRRPSRQGPVRPLRPAALRPGARPGGGVRRTRPVRRASAGVTPVRAGALLAILAGSAAIWGLANSEVFGAHRTTITGATWTSEARILELLGIEPGANVFGLRTGDLAASLAAVPAIRGATVTVALPDEVRVAVDERVALMAWRVADRSFLVDADGKLFAELPADPPEAAAALPAVDDARLSSMVLEVGSTLDPVTLDAALRLASLAPADVGSGARELLLRIDDENGFVMRTRPGSWSAVFGFYTPTLRTTDLIPGQVRLLRSLLAGRENTVARVVLADDQSGTYVPFESAEPTRSPKPGRTPKPEKTQRPDRTPKPDRTPRPDRTARPDATATPGETPTP